MGKKLALIEAVAHGPGLLLLDEPSLGLDYTSQLAFQRKVRELAGAGAAVVLASNQVRSEEHTSELQSRQYLVCRLLLAKKKRPDQRTAKAPSLDCSV